MKPVKSMLVELRYGNAGTVLIRIVLGVIFLLAGISKIIDPFAFSGSVVAYGFVSHDVAPYVAISVPSLEIVLGVLLIAGYKIKAAVFSLVCLMLVFSLVVLVNILWGKHFQCGCFNIPVVGSFLGGKVGPKLLVRNIIILILLVLVFFAKNNILSIDSLIEKLKLKNI